VSETTNTPMGPVPEELIEPAAIIPDATTERVYPRPGVKDAEGEPVPDFTSHHDFTEYAKSRFDPPKVVNGVELITYNRYVPRHRLEREGWIMSPKVAAWATIGLFALTNVVGNARNFANLGADAWDSAKDTISHLLHRKPHTVEVSTKVPGHKVVLDDNFNEQVNSSAPNAADVQTVLDQIRGHRANGDKLTNITVTGSASDEWGPQASSLGHSNAGNGNLQHGRAGDFADALTGGASQNGDTLPDIAISGQEDILDQAAIDHLRSEAAKHHISLDEAIAMFDNNPGKLDPALRSELQAALGDKRSVHVHAEFQTPDKWEHHSVPAEHHKPEHRDYDWDLYWSIPVPFIPRLRRVGYTDVVSETWPRPAAEEDEAWVELYKEALKEDGSLVGGSWAWTRKYQQLAREDRIDYVLKHGYKDHDGLWQELRVLFVDHDPTEETIDAFKQLLTNTSEMRGGRIPEGLSAIAVFPRSQAGNEEGHDPADIALDIDKQDPHNVFGVATPALGLVEMHMPEEPTQEELDGYCGVRWVFAHEVAGHWTSTLEEPAQLTPVGPTQVRHYVSSNPWADVVPAAVEALPGSDAEGDRQLRVTRQIATRSGKLITREEVVNQDSDRLEEAQEVSLLGRKPTRYSAEHPLELFAEVAANYVTGIEIPYREAGMEVTPLDADLAQGYHADPRLHEMVMSRTGFNRNGALEAHDSEFTFTEATDDPVLRAMIARARRTPMPHDRITILAKTTAD
jgi:hypothetical protein